jgi:8-amino-7-oxononanoate synthase
VLDSLAEALAAELRALADADRLRALAPLAGADRTHPTLGDRSLLAFCSNDYLGLANHPALLAAAAHAAERSGFGAGAARLVSGDLPEHRDLEAAVAAHVGAPAALLFPTGYQTNIGVLTALASREDLIVSDAANHASIIDGCRLSRAEIAVYPHRDADAARAALAAAGRRHRRRLLVTESLFSMDGDTAPLADLARAAREHDAALVVDEAHALGVAGPGGAGLCRATGVTPDVLVGTLGKALGSLGGFAAGSADLRAVLLNRARTFIFTTASPAPVLAAAAAALGIIQSDEGAQRRATLQARITQLRSALGLADDASPIIPVILGTDRAALDASARLRAAGLFVQAIRPPTVPDGTARLRVTLSAAHTAADVDRLVAALRTLGTTP